MSHALVMDMGPRQIRPKVLIYFNGLERESEFEQINMVRFQDRAFPFVSIPLRLMHSGHSTQINRLLLCLFVLTAFGSFFFSKCSLCKFQSHGRCSRCVHRISPNSSPKPQNLACHLRCLICLWQLTKIWVSTHWSYFAKFVQFFVGTTIFFLYKISNYFTVLVLSAQPVEGIFLCFWNYMKMVKIRGKIFSQADKFNCSKKSETQFIPPTLRRSRRCAGHFHLTLDVCGLVYDSYVALLRYFRSARVTPAVSKSAHRDPMFSTHNTAHWPFKFADLTKHEYLGTVLFSFDFYNGQNWWFRAIAPRRFGWRTKAAQ